MAEQVDRRILGAVRPVDAVTGTPILAPLRIEGTGLTLRRNRSGHYAIMAADGLGDHLTAFDDPPAAPPAESLTFALTVEDPRGAWLPRRLAIALPRPWNPAGGIHDLMQPVAVPLAPSAARSPSPGWAVVLAIVTDTGGDPVRGALVEVLPEGGGDRLGWGITHARGEALVPVPGLPAFREIENDPDDDEDDDIEIVTAQTAVTVRATALPGGAWPVDPDVLGAGGAALRSATLTPLPITPGRTDRAPITLNMN